jgi:hypothetical protein
MTKCLNYEQCGNKARPPHALYQSCQDTIKRLLNDDAAAQTLAKLETKPRNVLDVFGMRKK